MSCKHAYACKHAFMCVVYGRADHLLAELPEVIYGSTLLAVNVQLLAVSISVQVFPGHDKALLKSI